MIVYCVAEFEEPGPQYPATYEDHSEMSNREKSKRLRNFLLLRP